MGAGLSTESGRDARHQRGHADDANQPIEPGRLLCSGRKRMDFCQEGGRKEQRQNRKNGRKGAVVQRQETDGFVSRRRTVATVQWFFTGWICVTGLTARSHVRKDF